VENTKEREERLAEIQRRIEEGTYVIDLQHLAERIVDDSDLLDRDRRLN
jgi:anti-sigma28 factor (negative regulator of flagellin synthesis)